MLKIYQEELRIRSRDCDSEGVMRPSAVLAAMQDVADVHSETLGCGRNVLVRQNIVWVLSRSEVHMDRYPLKDERIVLKTFPMANRRWFFPRYFLVEDAAGREIGRGATLWLLFDLNTRRMAPPDAAVRYIPDNSDLTPPLGLPANVEGVPDAEETISVRAPLYSDIDVNRHVNNARYVDWACDALGYDLMRENCLKTIRIQYSAEIRPGQEIELHTAQNGRNYRVIGFHEGREHFAIGGELMRRC